MIELSPIEIRDLRQVCEDSLNLGNEGSAGRAWERIQKTFACELDTDGDKNCHVCFARGGCPLNRKLKCLPSSNVRTAVMQDYQRKNFLVGNVGVVRWQ